jgi:lipopolysaccharide/colanic/teichoic acid biosynthesis glycosyltransferase
MSEAQFSQAATLLRSPRRRVVGYAGWGKRSLDLVAVAVLLLPVALVLVLLAILVRAEGGQPFFGHARVGRGGRTFTCWKIRTMVPDAEARLEEVLRRDPKAADQWAQYQKLDNDPRVTRLGHLLRRTSLDELPQLWNVLRGDMSLVGPRPVTRVELERYGSAASDYVSVRPGLTGLWQVEGRNALTYAERVALDQHYARKLTFREDLRILSKTVSVVLARTGS